MLRQENWFCWKVIKRNKELNRRQSSENVWKRSSSLRNHFGKSSEIFGKWSSDTSLLVCLYNKIVLRSLVRYRVEPALEDKIHIHVRAFNILYIFYESPWSFVYITINNFLISYYTYKRDLFGSIHSFYLNATQTVSAACKTNSAY